MGKGLSKAKTGRCARGGFSGLAVLGLLALLVSAGCTTVDCSSEHVRCGAVYGGVSGGWGGW